MDGTREKQMALLTAGVAFLSDSLIALHPQGSKCTFAHSYSQGACFTASRPRAVSTGLPGQPPSPPRTPLSCSAPPFQQLSFLRGGFLSNLYLRSSSTCPVPLLQWLLKVRPRRPLGGASGAAGSGKCQDSCDFLEPTADPGTSCHRPNAGHEDAAWPCPTRGASCLETGVLQVLAGPTRPAGAQSPAVVQSPARVGHSWSLGPSSCTVLSQAAWCPS